MAAIGDGYGSECHLLRYLGRHRERLDAAVIKATGAARLRWIDCPFEPSQKWKDGRWSRLDFLPDKNKARKKWPDFLPEQDKLQHWDAVGLAEIDGAVEWILVEAKAHLGELRSDCLASAGNGLTPIREALAEIKSDLGVREVLDWLSGYYQYCNRIAALWFLRRHKLKARLLFIYFTGDEFPMHAFECPEDADGWSQALDERRRHVGLPADHDLSGRMHEIFLPVAGPASEVLRDPVQAASRR
ncbi:MAG TPA: hypothetical protein VM325_07460 [Alphaproteobacteria bacterium]|nr:hypothetical protein [Alphaproteobacteria bacterium]